MQVAPMTVEQQVAPVTVEHAGGTDAGNEENEGAHNGKLAYLRAFSCASIMGFAFGFLFEKSHVYEPANIRGQFNFERWVMLKMFMGAVASSCLSFVLLAVSAPERFDLVRRNFVPPCRGYVTGGVLGGMLLGCGMAAAGACPGMVLPQVGTGLPNALLTSLGGLVGALTFGLLEPCLRPALLDVGTQSTDKPDGFLDVRLQKPFVALSAGLGIMCGAFAAVLEVLVNFEGELGLTAQTNNALGSNFFLAKAWPPALCGALLGFLQLPAAVVLADSLGSSTSYQCIASQVLTPFPPSARGKFTYMEGHRTGLGSWWQVFYAIMAILGAYVSAKISDSLPTRASGVSVSAALVGGFLMIFGSRLGGGCTSGHGISGMPLLYDLSIVAVCAMFGAGIVSGLIMDAFNVLEVPPLHGRF